MKDNPAGPQAPMTVIVEAGEDLRPGPLQEDQPMNQITTPRARAHRRIRVMDEFEGNAPNALRGIHRGRGNQ